jgi:hypothetical protein
MSLEGVEARESSQVPSFFFSLFLTELLESVKAECALLIEERRRKPLRSLARLGGWPIYEEWDPWVRKSLKLQEQEELHLRLPFPRRSPDSSLGKRFTRRTAKAAIDSG